MVGRLSGAFGGSVVAMRTNRAICLLLLLCLGSGLAWLPSRSEAAPDIASQIAKLEEQVAGLQREVTALKEAQARAEQGAESVRLRVGAVEAFSRRVEGAFAQVARPEGVAPGGAVPTVPDGRVDAFELRREGQAEAIHLKVVSGLISGLGKPARLELAISIGDSGGIVRKVYTATSVVVANATVVWIESTLAISTDGNEDNWFRNLIGKDGRPDREKISKLVVTFRVLRVLSP